MTNRTNHKPKIGLRDVFLSFLRSEAIGGILLFVAASLAMIIANSPLREYYFNFWHFELGVWLKLGDFGEKFLGFSIHQWISDVLMALFFLLVGLEIKREVIFGELATFKKAIFPALAALGGMIFPGIIYFSLNYGTPSAHGFGIPMATDIAFALGVIMLLKNKVPMALKVFLVTLAVVDDLGAIVVIAIFYANGLHYAWFIAALGLVGVLILMNRFGIKSLFPYLFVGVLLWFAVHHSGIHATIAAVALAFCIPVVPKRKIKDFIPLIKNITNDFINRRDTTQKFLDDSQIRDLCQIQRESISAQSPLGRLERALSPWSAYFIMPLFGFANAGVSISQDINFQIDHIFLGVALGLIVGKPLGIFLTTFLCEKIGIASRPNGVSWLQILGVGMLGGIGFTMSIFISDLAFKNSALESSENYAILATELSKIAILSSSLCAGIIGAIFLILVAKIKKK